MCQGWQNRSFPIGPRSCLLFLAGCMLSVFPWCSPIIGLNWDSLQYVCASLIQSAAMLHILQRQSSLRYPCIVSGALLKFVSCILYLVSCILTVFGVLCLPQRRRP